MALSLLKPPALHPGDRVAAVTLSWAGPGTFPHRYRAGVRQLEETLGLTVVEMPHTLADADWLYRRPQARAEDLMAAFADPSIRAVITTIGGDDSIRTLPYIDLNLLRSNPKIFLGFSDTTVTHLACLKAGLVSFYGPSMMTGFAENGGMFPYTVDALRRTLFSTDPPGSLHPSTEGWTVEFLDWADPALQERRRTLNLPLPWRWLQGQGVRRGRLIGGCLDVLDWLPGLEIWPDLDTWQDAVLFLETSEDAPPPAAVIYFLRRLAALGVLPRLSGILFARPGGGVPLEQFDTYDQALLTVVKEEEGLDDLPVITCLDFGHTDPVFVLPYGVQAEIDCLQKRLSIIENTVSE